MKTNPLNPVLCGGNIWYTKTKEHYNYTLQSFFKSRNLKTEIGLSILLNLV